MFVAQFGITSIVAFLQRRENRQKSEKANDEGIIEGIGDAPPIGIQI